MKEVFQLFKGMEEKTTRWFTRLTEQPEVKRFYQVDTWVGIPELVEDDWKEARFMDSEEKGMLILYLTHTRKMASVSLFVLDGRSDVAAKLMRHLMNVLIRQYNIQILEFSIADSNTEWLRKLEKRFGMYKWGVEPETFYDTKLGRYVAAHRFKVFINGRSPKGIWRT